MSDFSGKKVWIIGASAGIGKALAQLLSQKGHEIFISARNKEGLEKIKLESTNPDKCHVVAFDVTDQKAVEKATRKIGDFDIMIFLAGIYKPGNLEKFDLEEYKKTIDINLYGALNVFGALKDRIYSEKPIHLAWTVSGSAYQALPNANAYGISKAGLLYFIKLQKIELPRNVKVQMINPGFVKSRLTDKNKFKMPFLISADKAAEEIYKGLQKNIFDIHFPKAFTFWLKLLSFIPDWLYLRLISSRD